MGEFEVEMHMSSSEQCIAAQVEFPVNDRLGHDAFPFHWQELRKSMQAEPRLQQTDLPQAKR